MTTDEIRALEPNVRLRRMIVDQHGSEHAIDVIDGSGHVKQGDKTPGVQRQLRRRPACDLHQQ